MRRYGLLLSGMVMAGAGSYLIFGNPDAFPLWVVWLAGSFLWYVGIAVTIGGLGSVLLSRHKKAGAQAAAPARRAQESMTLKFKTLQCPPAGVLHEIPSMGGFIL